MHDKAHIHVYKHTYNVSRYIQILDYVTVNSKITGHGCAYKSFDQVSFLNI